jgi:hypothetical protein
METCPSFLLGLAKNTRSTPCKLMVGLLGNLPFEIMQYFNEEIHSVKTLTI